MPADGIPEYTALFQHLVGHVAKNATQYSIPTLYSHPWLQAIRGQQAQVAGNSGGCVSERRLRCFWVRGHPHCLGQFRAAHLPGLECKDPGERCSTSGPAASAVAIFSVQFTAETKRFLLGKLQSGTVITGSPKYSSADASVGLMVRPHFPCADKTDLFSFPLSYLQEGWAACGAEVQQADCCLEPASPGELRWDGADFTLQPG